MTTLINILRTLLFPAASQKGSSLVQVMVIAGMVSVFGLAVMQTQKNVSTVKQSLAVRDSNNELRQAIVALLKYPDVCEENFSTVTATTANNNRGVDQFPITLPLIRDANGNAAFKKYNSSTPQEGVYFSKARIESISLGHFDPARNLATLRVVLNNTETDTSKTTFNRLNIGGKQVNVDIAMRFYFQDSSTGLKRCFAEEQKIEVDTSGNYLLTDQSSLEKLCTDDLAGSFFNGDCHMPQYILRNVRDENDSTPDPGEQRSICHNFGGTVVNGQCEARWKGAEVCPDGLRVTGFDSFGRFVCGAAP